MRKFWYVFAILCLLISFYPLLYFASATPLPFILSKSEHLQKDPIWNLFFYIHISFGGLALLSGWSQFSKKFRIKRIYFHRALGRVYVISCFMSGIAGVYLGYYANGGFFTSLGFMLLGVSWVLFSVLALHYIWGGDKPNHQFWMTYSFAACFAAVTLRLWLPILQLLIDDPPIAYAIVAWLCWVPNYGVAHFINKYRSNFVY